MEVVCINLIRVFGGVFMVVGMIEIYHLFFFFIKKKIYTLTRSVEELASPSILHPSKINKIDEEII